MAQSTASLITRRGKWLYEVIVCLALLVAVLLQWNQRWRAHEEANLSMVEAIQQADTARIRSALANGATVVESPDGKTALSCAVWEGDLALARQLLRLNARVNPGKDARWPPLHRAVLSESAEMVRLLLGHGADPNLPDSDGMYPIHIAGLNERCEVLKVLISGGARLDTRDAQGYSAFLAAAGGGSKEQMELLIQLGADWREVDRKGNTGLHLCVMRAWGMRGLRAAGYDHDPHYLVAARYLLELGLSPYTENKRGVSPLQFARHREMSAFVRLMESEVLRGTAN